MSKVRPEAFLWGAGTALGELPPYFMARASRLSGFDPEDDDDLKAFEELKKKRESGAQLSMLDRAKVSMERVVERVGFLGILACASVSFFYFIQFEKKKFNFLMFRFQIHFLIWPELRAVISWCHSGHSSVLPSSVKL